MFKLQLKQGAELVNCLSYYKGYTNKAGYCPYTIKYCFFAKSVLKITVKSSNNS